MSNPPCLDTMELLLACKPETIHIATDNFVWQVILPTSPGGPFWPQHPPTKAIPMLSVWILGTGFRAQVEPFGTTGHTESSTNMPLIGWRVPLFHIWKVFANSNLPNTQTYNGLLIPDKLKRHLLELFLCARHLLKRAQTVLVTSPMVEPHTPGNPGKAEDNHVQMGITQMGEGASPRWFVAANCHLLF